MQFLSSKNNMDNVLEILIFNVGQAQSIFFYPRSNPEYGMFIDCAESDDCKPIDFLLKNGFIYHNGQKHILSNLTITNYDQDHFSGLPSIREKVHIDTVRLPKNISSQELKNIKEDVTNALEHVCYLKDTYTGSAEHHKPPYKMYSYHLEQHELESEDINTNHLSQLVFIEYCGSKICICGDLEKPAWEKIIQKTDVQNHLKSTHVLVAPHHGHDNGYHDEIFKHCTNLDCVIISDKELMYDTQDAMANTYAQHVRNGVNFKGATPTRKVLTTRNDGHLWLRFDPYGNRFFQNFIIE